MQKDLVFVKGFSGKAKKSGKLFCSVDLIDNHSINSFNGEEEVKILSFFSETVPAIMEDLNFGDVVTCHFEPVDLSGKPKLIDILKVVEKSPY
jgi:hypothetical protein